MTGDGELLGTLSSIHAQLREARSEDDRVHASIIKPLERVAATASDDGSATRLLAQLRADASAPVDVRALMRAYLVDGAAQLRHILKITSGGRTDFEDPAFLGFTVDPHEPGLNATIERSAPYSIFLNLDLILFFAAVTELTLAGLPIPSADGSPPAPPRMEVEEIAQAMRDLLDAHHETGRVPDATLTGSLQEHGIHLCVMQAIMSFTVGHELGHMLITELRREGRTPMFRDQAYELVDRFVPRHIELPIHQLMSTRYQLGRGTERERVLDSWREECHADLLGAGLAIEYQVRKGPWKFVSGVRRLTKLGVDLALTSLFLIDVYEALRYGVGPRYFDHPPADLRAKVFASGMSIGGREAQFTKEVIEYMRTIHRAVVAGL